MVIDIKFVPPVAVFHVTRITHIHIQPAIVIDINHYSPGAPHAILFHAAFGSNIFKLEITFIEVKLVLIHVRGKQYIGQAIVINVANSHSAAIIKIAE